MLFCLLALLLPCTAALELFVSPTGHDNATGTKSDPFQTIIAARDHIRTLPKLPVGGVSVNILGGSYGPLQLDHRDSGAPGAQIEYIGYNGAEVSAGVSLPASGWHVAAHPFTNETVYTINLSSFGILDIGSMLTGGLGDCMHDKLELFYEGKPMILARWPNLFPNGSWQFVPITAAPNDHSFAIRVDGSRPARWASETDPWVHGYFAWNWWDVYVPLTSIACAGQGSSCLLNTSVTVDANTRGRLYAVNMRSELDVRGEYYVANAQELLFIPPDGQPPRTSVVSVSPNALSAAGLSYVTFRSLGFVHARQAGASLTQSDHIVFSECEFALNGGDGLGLSAIDSAIQGSHVHDVGCSGIYVASGDAYQLANGNLLVQDNTIERFGRWKRTYRPGLGWSGAGLTVRGNTLRDSPHAAILSEGLGVNSLFEYNTIDFVCKEVSDAGAFYTCGQAGLGWISRGNVVQHNLFSRIRNWDDHLQTSVQALYIDDQISGYLIQNNTFSNCSVGLFMGGGRDNTFLDNNFEYCDLAVHLDARGIGWQNASARFPTGDLWTGLDKVHASQPPWSFEFPALLNMSYAGLPVNTQLRGSRYCKCNQFVDVTPADIRAWGMTLVDNVPFTGC